MHANMYVGEAWVNRWMGECGTGYFQLTLTIPGMVLSIQCSSFFLSLSLSQDLEAAVKRIGIKVPAGKGG